MGNVVVLSRLCMLSLLLCLISANLILQTLCQDLLAKVEDRYFIMLSFLL